MVYLQVMSIGTVFRVYVSTVECTDFIYSIYLYVSLSLVMIKVRIWLG